MYTGTYVNASKHGIHLSEQRDMGLAVEGTRARIMVAAPSLDKHTGRERTKGLVVSPVDLRAWRCCSGTVPLPFSAALHSLLQQRSGQTNRGMH